jgi:acyl-CoA thioester hydrolase
MTKHKHSESPAVIADNVFFEGPVLWSQVDANKHLRHSAYADFAAQARLMVLHITGVDAKLLEEQKIGPILFREELIYLREIGLNDSVKVTCSLSKTRKDGSRWSFTQDIYRGDGIKAAVVNTDGAWIDIEKRKLTTLPEEIMDKFKTIPRSEHFVEE